MHVHMCILLQIIPLYVHLDIRIGTCTLYLQKHDVCTMYVYVHMYLKCTCTVYSTCMTLIGVHELHGRTYPNQGHVANLFAVDPLSLFGYLTVSTIHPVTSL